MSDGHCPCVRVSVYYIHTLDLCACFCLCACVFISLFLSLCVIVWLCICAWRYPLCVFVYLRICVWVMVKELQTRTAQLKPLSLPRIRMLSEQASSLPMSLKDKNVHLSICVCLCSSLSLSVFQFVFVCVSHCANSSSRECCESIWRCSTDDQKLCRNLLWGSIPMLWLDCIW